MEIVFFIFLFLSVYSYLIFPGILWILQLVFKNPWKRRDSRLPAVSLIISAYNEETVIAKKVQNALGLDYPKKLLEIVVASDGSHDRTDEIVSAISDQRVSLYAFAERSGKTACLNRVVPHTKGDIVVFTDANSIYPDSTIQTLVRNFADDSIGCVTGWTKYIGADGTTDETGLYAKFERWIKIQESRISSCVGADGAIFAIRKEMFQRLEDRDINDFITPLDVIGQRRRVVMDPEAFCWEDASDATGKAYRRQVRITNRTLSAIRRRWLFLNPFRYGCFSFFLISHKILRLFTPFFLLATMSTNLFLIKNFSIYWIFCLASLSFILCGTVGLFTGNKNRLISVCKLFLITFTAQLIGSLRLLAGIEDRIWKPER